MPEFTPIGGRRKLFSRQIPTIFGLLILMVALAAGVLFFNEGFKGFAPRATPETTPKNVKITNLSDTGFTVSFLTDASTTGFIKYGTNTGNLDQQAGDDRDQLSGSVGDYTLHHITVRGLNPTTQYYFVLATGGETEFDNEGNPFTVTTGPPVSNPSSKTIYGNVVDGSGSPAEGAIVFVKSANSGELSTLVKNSGSWAVPLNLARTVQGTEPAVMEDSTQLQIMAQGTTPDLTANVSATVANAQPVETITLGMGGSTVSTDSTPAPTATPMAESSDTTMMAGNTTETNEVVDLTLNTQQTVTTGQPVIVGQAAPNVTVTLEVHSDTNITQQVAADEDGLFALDIAALSQTLEPGEHTATYSYVDPSTGQTVTKTQTFIVSDSSTLLAQANTGGPFSSGNPFPAATVTLSPTAIPTVLPSPSPSPTPRATASASATPRPTPLATNSATRSGQTSQPSTGSGLPVSGSTGITVALIGGGLFFLLAGAWSFWVAHHLNSRRSD